MKAAAWAALLGLASIIIPPSARAFSYPALDTTSHWTLQDWGADPGLGFHVRGAAKRVWTAPGQAEDRTVFYDFACVGVELDGTRYPLGSLQYQGEFEGQGYIARYGFFQVTAGTSIGSVLYFYDDGKFRLTGFLTGSDVGTIRSWRMLARADYDMAGSGNDLAEFAWSGASEGASQSPPQYPAREAADGRLEFVPGGPAYWAASSHEITIAYPPMPPATDHGVENSGFARIFDGDHPRFGMVFWGDAATAVTATFKAYSAFDGNLAPAPDVSEILQITDQPPDYPRYAVAGRDQMLFLSLEARGPWDACDLSGKLFQRPASRPLAVTVRQHPPEYLAGWDFDPDRTLRVTGDGERNFRNALAELAGPEDLTVSRSGHDGVLYLPFDGYADPGQAVTEAQLHDLMTATRDYGAASLEDVRDWRLDLFVVDWTLEGEPDVWEAMFDYGNADDNGISREGAAVFWPALGGNGEDWRGRQAVLSALHGAGLALNMHPSWGVCPSAGFCWNDASACHGLRCGGSCPPGASGCRYQAYDCAQECSDGSIMSLTDVDHNTLRFNSSPAAGSSHSEIDWYRRAPEAWAKPGRFGIGPVAGPMPSFYAE